MTDRRFTGEGSPMRDLPEGDRCDPDDSLELHRGYGGRDSPGQEEGYRIRKEREGKEEETRAKEEKQASSGRQGVGELGGCTVQFRQTRKRKSSKKSGKKPKTRKSQGSRKSKKSVKRRKPTRKSTKKSPRRSGRARK
jgi:hypothetical protein